MASGYPLPPPPPLDIHGTQAADNWKKFKRAWTNFSLATELNKKPEPVQVATLLTVIGEEAREVFATFTGWAEEGDDAKIVPVLGKFAAYCEPRKSMPFERYRFNKRAQEPGESYEQYRTTLRKLSESCEFQSITPEEILRDRLIFGIRDVKVRERLLREPNLLLAKTDQICRAAESMTVQMKEIADESTAAVHMVKEPETQKKNPDKSKTTSSTRECWNCGRKHEYYRRDLCPAYGKTCNRCHKLNHFASKCRTVTNKPSVRAIEDEDVDEVFPADVAAVHLDDSHFITLKLKSGNFMRFQVDTGAQCNVVPLDLYKQATQDISLQNVRAIQSQITAYGGTTLPVVGQAVIEVERNNHSYDLECKLVDSTNIRPLLGRGACLNMNVVTYLDNDKLNKPDTQDAEVFVIEDTTLSLQQLVRKFPRVFKQGVGRLAGEYHIRLKDNANPVQHAPRRVPVALREQLKKTLDNMVKERIITPVTDPTPWISSMVVVRKKNGALRICLDPKELNKAIQRENYPLPTIEDVATRLYGAKVFTVLDVRSGFWHVVLDKPSSLLTTFHTPFGRYRWNRMPFGICSAPEIFQRRIHEVIEGLTGVEVIADDFVVVGRGDTGQIAAQDHDKNLNALLQRCIEQGLMLNPDKIKLRMQKVPFIGHVATDKGLCVDPHKVKAIADMPPPTDVAAVQRLLGLAQYLSKFLPHLANMTKPLRDLTQKDTAWVWDDPQQTAFAMLKNAVSSTPILRYYNLKEPVTIQCDASQSGLGAVLMQNGQPVGYASRALTPTESQYAQIEKELLAIVFACDHFEAYIYGRDEIHVETDHKPLESIMRKPLNNAPTRLQRMLLKLQKHNLSVTYRKGTTIVLADTLSRAYLSDDDVCEFSTNLETVDHTSSLMVRKDRLQQIKHATKDDPVLLQLKQMIQSGWPNDKKKVPPSIRAYYDFRDELIVQDHLVFKGSKLVIPVSMRREMMSIAHSSHIGVEGCIRRVRDTLYWPQMSKELKEYISKCDICLSYQSSPGREPILQHEITERPWAKIGVDLCELDGRILLVVCDYYSNFIEIDNINRATSQTVCKSLKCMFSRYGVPDIVISDNGPQFSAAEFSEFANKWAFKHETSSPHYPQSNGKAENAVKTVKRLLTKCRKAGQSEYLALLDWRNRPTEGMGTSPAQRFLGRRCKTLLPVTQQLLSPRYPVKDDARALRQQKLKQQHYYNRRGRPLKHIEQGDTVRIRLPGQSTWSCGICKTRVGPRSYEIEVGGATYRRNRSHIIPTKEQRDSDIPLPHLTQEGETVRDGVLQPGETSNNNNTSQQGATSPQLQGEPSTPSLDNAPVPRRSDRTRRPPRWMVDFVPS